MLAAERGGVRRPSSWSVAEERTKVRLPTKAGSGLVAASVPLSKPVKPTIVQTDKKAKAALKRRWQEVAPAADIDSEDDDGDGSNEEVAVEAKAREKPRLSIATMPLPELLRRREDIKIELTDHAEKILEAPEKALIGSGGRPLKVVVF